MFAVPGTPLGSLFGDADDALQGVDTNVSEFEKSWFKAVGVISEDYGGPAQYLREVLNEQSSQEAFALYLWSEFPEQADQAYEFSWDDIPVIPEDEMATSTPVCLHPPLGTLLGQRAILKMGLRGVGRKWA